jgi:hypothetical protein
MYLGIPKGDWKQGWVIRADMAKGYSKRSTVKQIISKRKEEGLRIIRWKIEEEIVE